jgi:hypothetical protein
MDAAPPYRAPSLVKDQILRVFAQDFGHLRSLNLQNQHTITKNKMQTKYERQIMEKPPGSVKACTGGKTDQD